MTVATSFRMTKKTTVPNFLLRYYLLSHKEFVLKGLGCLKVLRNSSVTNSKFLIPPTYSLIWIAESEFDGDEFSEKLQQQNNLFSQTKGYDSVEYLHYIDALSSQLQQELAERHYFTIPRICEVHVTANALFYVIVHDKFLPAYPRLAHALNQHAPHHKPVIPHLPPSSEVRATYIKERTTYISPSQNKNISTYRASDAATQTKASQPPPNAIVREQVSSKPISLGVNSVPQKPSIPSIVIQDDSSTLIRFILILLFILGTLILVAYMFFKNNQSGFLGSIS